jgi:hypothetical protein
MNDANNDLLLQFCNKVPPPRDLSACRGVSVGRGIIRETKDSRAIVLFLALMYGLGENAHVAVVGKTADSIVLLCNLLTKSSTPSWSDMGVYWSRNGNRITTRSELTRLDCDAICDPIQSTFTFATFQYWRAFVDATVMVVLYPEEFPEEFRELAEYTTAKQFIVLTRERLTCAGCTTVDL